MRWSSALVHWEWKPKVLIDPLREQRAPREIIPPTTAREEASGRVTEGPGALRLGSPRRSPRENGAQPYVIRQLQGIGESLSAIARDLNRRMVSTKSAAI